jgi:hypothetical protein
MLQLGNMDKARVGRRLQTGMEQSADVLRAFLR